MGQTRAFKQGFFNGLVDFNAVADIGEYGGPTLVVTGRRDAWSPTWRAKKFREADAKVTFMEFDVGHRMGADIGIRAVHQVSEATLKWLLERD